MSEKWHTVHIKGRPPSVNSLYTRAMHGRRVLTKEGIRFKKKALDAIAHSWLFEGGFNPQAIYHVIIEVWLPHDVIFTKTKSAKHPVKQLDATNFTKIVEDALSDAIEVDDRYFFRVTTSKEVAHDESAEGVTVYLREVKRLG